MFSPDKWFGKSKFYNGVATQSLRFNDNDSNYLSRTPSGAGNRRTFTWSAWIKRTNLDANTVGSNDCSIFSAGDSNDVSVLRFLSQLTPAVHGGDQVTDQLEVYTYYTSTATDYSEELNKSFRDVASWYHIVFSVDTTQASAGNRIKYYVNGTLQTAVSQYYAQIPQDYDFNFNNTVEHNIGRNAHNPSRYFDGYMSEVNFVDGTQLDASYFGETKGGVWIPKLYTGSYGTNGYRLEFKGVGGSADANGIGADTSGNGNHWSIGNLGGHDSNNPDCPENNYVTLNVLHYLTSDAHMSDGALRVTHSSTAHRAFTGTHLPRSGKWYFEVRNDNNAAVGTVAIGVGFQEETQNMSYATGNDNYVFYCNNNNARFVKNTSASTLSTDGTHTPDAGDIIQVAYDADTGKVFIGINNTYIAADGGSDGDPAGGSNETATLSTSLNYLPFVGVYNNAGTVNFGQDDTFGNRTSAGGFTDSNRQGIFKYAPPAGFLALCADNFEEPTIGPNSETQPSDHFEIVGYTGNATDNKTVTGVGFQPDWIWTKNLKDTDYHRLYDSSRGAQASLSTALTSESEQTSDGGVKSFDSDGFTLGSTSYANRSAGEYVAWNWKANGGTTSSFAEAGNNPGGTIQTNVTAGFSIITYTGTGGAGTIAHGLGVAPRWVLVKRRDGTGWSWYNQHAEFLSGSDGSVYTNSTALGDDDSTHWNDTAPTSSVVTLGTSGGVNADNGTYVMYAFAEIEGYSKFDTYAADNYGSDPSSGELNGPFIHTGFRPSFVMLKNISNTSGAEWVMLDDHRTGVSQTRTINPILSFIEANTNNQEFDSSSYPLADFVSNGFKLRTGGANTGVGRAINRASGDNYIYMAFAHQPFKYANAF